MNIPINFLTLPSLLQPVANNLWQDYIDKATPAELTNLTQHPLVVDSIAHVWTCSPFVANSCIQSPTLLHNLLETGDLLRSIPTAYTQRLEKLLLGCKDETIIMHELRLYRKREMVRIAWRDLANWATLEETLRSLSDLADAILDVTLTWLYQHLTAQFGTPTNANGTPQPLIVLGLGKLGGQELNFSSDIDLIFAYPEQGETIGVKRPRSNQEFFLRLGQNLIRFLDQNTADGIVYRVDMRLRPFGEAGALTLSFAAMEEYYETHARNW